MLSPLCLVFALFFTFPANLLIYGANDIFDYETDRLNQKKVEYEALVAPTEHRRLWLSIALCCLPFLFFLLFIPRPSLLALAGFLFFSLFYSAPPLRAKAHPVVDSAFNVLYIFPGVFAYFLSGGRHFSLSLFFGAWAWAMAMHAYSAVPDISADREAGVPTVATFLGLQGTLYFCLALYLFAAIVSFPALHWLSVVLGLVYRFLIVRSMSANSETGVMRLYRLFPIINTAAGGAIWWLVFAMKPAFWPF